jgi:ribonuclease VapC
MVIDTSALVAILLNEPGASRLVSSIERAEDRLISVATVIEASLVLLGRFGEAGELQLDALLRSIRAELVPVDAEQMAIAREAARAFGRGRHRAALNFGDCFSYAVAVSRGEPLLFVGDDFTHTDVVAEHW